MLLCEKHHYDHDYNLLLLRLADFNIDVWCVRADREVPLHVYEGKCCQAGKSLWW